MGFVSLQISYTPEIPSNGDKSQASNDTKSQPRKILNLTMLELIGMNDVRVQKDDFF